MENNTNNNGTNSNYTPVGGNTNMNYTPVNGGNQPPQNSKDDADIKSGRKGFWTGFVTALVCMLLVVCILFVVFRSLGTNLFNQMGILTTGNNTTDEVLSSSVISKIQALENSIDTYYYKTDVDKQDEADGLYKGLIDSLGDPYSTYYTAEEFEELMNDTEGVYYGIGAYVSMDNDIQMPRIAGVIEGSPAEEAGLMTDDIIYEIEGESTKGLELSVVVSKIKGEEGTTVHIKFYRQSTDEYPEMDIERRQIESPTVKTEMLDNGIGYLQITEFDEVTYTQFVDGMQELRDQDMKGLILDLRSNPGGSLSAVCKIANELLPEGTIVYTVDRDGKREDYTSTGENEIDIPVVVLINGYSASASEILSGALKDYEKATLVGTTTYGKGVVQRVFSFKDNTAVKLTISNYYTPNGNDINGVGIEPDVELEFDADSYVEDKTDNQKDKAVEILLEQLQ